MGQSSGLNLKDVIRHLPRWDASLWGVKARQMAEVRSLQSHLHDVYGRRASLPLSSMSEVLGIKTVLLSANQSGKALPSKDNSISIKGELRTHATSTPVSTVGNSVKARSRVFWKQGGHQIQPDQWSNRCHQALVEQIAKYLRAGDASGLPRVPGKPFPIWNATSMDNPLLIPANGLPCVNESLIWNKIDKACTSFSCA